MVLWIPGGAHHGDTAHGAETASIWSTDMAANWRERGKKGKKHRRNENEKLEEGRRIKASAWRKRENGDWDRRSWRLLRNSGSKRDYTDNETKERQLRTLRHSTNWQPIGEWSQLTQWSSRQTDVPQSSQEALRSRGKYYIRGDRNHLSQWEAWKVVKLQNVGTHGLVDACHQQEEIVLKSTPFNQLSGVLQWLPHLTRSHRSKLLRTCYTA